MPAAPTRPDSAGPQGPASSPPKVGGLLRGTALGLVQQALAMGLGILLLPLMLRSLGTEQFGVLLTLQLLSMAGVLGYTELGFQGAIVRYLAGHHATGRHEEFGRLLSSGLIAFLALGVVCALLVLAFAQWAFFTAFPVPQAYHAEVRAALAVYALAFLYQFPLQIVKAFYLAVHDLVGLRIWEIAERLTYFAAVVAVLLTSARLLHIVLVEQAIAFGMLALFWVVARLKHREFRPHVRLFSWQSLRDVSAMSGHVFGARLSQLVVLKLPEVIIASALGAAALAYFAIIAKLPRALKAIQSAANAAVLPLASSLDATGDQRRLVLLTLRSSRYAYFCLTPVAAFLAVFAADILRLWAGAEYAGLANPLRIFLAWQFIMLLVFQLNAALTRTEQLRRMNVAYLFANLAFLGVAIGAVDRFGIPAVLWALVTAAVITAAGALRVQQQTLGVTAREVYDTVVDWPVVRTGILTILACVVVRSVVPEAGVVTMTAILILGAAAYWAFVIRFAMDAQERTQLVTLAGRIRGA